MAVKTHVTKIEAAPEGGVLASIVIESDLGLIELEVHGDLKTDAAIRDPLADALEQVRQKLADFGRDLQDEMKQSNALAKMLRLSLPEYEENGGSTSAGSAQTGRWVSDGTTFYLQDVTSGKPLTANNTLATLVVHLL